MQSQMLLRTLGELDGDQKQTQEICMQTNRKCYIMGLTSLLSLNVISIGVVSSRGENPDESPTCKEMTS